MGQALSPGNLFGSFGVHNPMPSAASAPAAPPAPVVDPNLAAEQAAANNANITALQTQAQQDTASLMARYGTRMAMSSVTGSK